MFCNLWSEVKVVHNLASVIPNGTTRLRNGWGPELHYGRIHKGLT